ncbi:MAG: biotin--[acetyl-CoA-carboxylase] ligase [Firmicutes bacterium]|nr:biotin--[acetyl-CoA-carboxylase] ligase [Bacillota bacterium]
MKYKILELLTRADGYVSGEKISEKFNISRSAVWKHINALRKDGYEINSSTNKGYRLTVRPDTIDAGLLEKHLTGRVYYAKEIKSTNLWAKSAEDVPDGSLFITESQTGGRGRLGRTWSSPMGDGICMSLYLKPEISPAIVSQLTLVAGLAVSRVIEDAKIKWPNDVLIDDKKICGILTEMSAEMDRAEFVVIGIGININNTSFPEDLADKATSLYIEKGVKYDRNTIITDFLDNFRTLYNDFLKHGFLALKAEYEEKCVTLGRKVRIIRGEKEVIADAVRITDGGELVVIYGGKETIINSGEVSVRGLLGYN